MSVVHEVKKQMSEYVKKAKEISPSSFPPEKIPALAVEYVGGEGTGKTHAAMTFPNPAVCDTEWKDYVVMKKFNNNNWYPVRTFNEILSFYKTNLKNPEIKTLIFDSSKDLVDITEQFTLEELGKNTLYSSAGAVLYSRVYLKIDYLIQTARKNNKNIIFTSRLKDEYKDGSLTGKKIRDGYKKAPYQMDFVIQITRGIEWKGVKYFGDKLFGKILKNSYVKWDLSKPYIEDYSYNGIMNELFEIVDKNKYMKDLISRLQKVYIDNSW